MSVSRQATSSSFGLSSRKRVRGSLKRPVLIRSATIIGLDVAPVMPQPRLRTTSSGSTESSQTLVPVAINDCNGVMFFSRYEGHRTASRGWRYSIPSGACVLHSSSRHANCTTNSGLLRVTGGRARVWPGVATGAVMTVKSWSDFARDLALYARHKLGTTHRGALLIRRTSDGAVVAGVYGNDNYLCDGRSHREVDI